MKEGKTEEARKLLAAAVSEPLSDEEKGRALVSLAMLYIEVKNKINADLLADMKKTIETLKVIGKVEFAVNDKVKLAEVRETLK
ncbi:MAG: hypothetical protein JWO73_975 [Candidatus Taylorbacteria bacterium]|nr:hypothetical protein [Candidatus Taylorbacteria bacterium]